MSEQGWRQFLAADGVADWVVLHGGATALFRVGVDIEQTEPYEAGGVDHVTYRVVR